MSRNFLFADFIAHLKNCINAKLRFANFMHSKFVYSIAQILLAEGFIEALDERKDENGKKIISIVLSYKNAIPTIQELGIISKPSRRVYCKSRDIKRYRGGFGVRLFSTPLGIKTDKEARALRVGGEVLCYVF